jgi:nitrite reductase (NADH) large subunit
MCPVCGAPRDDFEQFEEKAPAPIAVPTSQWRCAVCGYVHEGAAAADECPVCGAGRDSFEPVHESAPAAPAVGGPSQIVIIGGGIAAVSAAEAARRTSAGAKITMISREPELPYLRLNLTRFLAGEIGDNDLAIHPPSWYAEQKIEVRTGTEVMSIGQKQVEVTGGKNVPFDKLILATGAHAFLPSVRGADRKNVITLRTVEDARRMVNSIRLGLKCVCIGGGILGLETAGALARRGAAVTLFESHAYLMPRQLSRRAGEIMKGFVEGIGITLRTEARTREITDGGVLLEDGATVPADLVIFTTGVRSNSHLARQAGLAVNNGIVVDNHLQSTNADIFAAGDSAEHNGVLYGSWAAAQYQGSIAGMNAAGSQVEFGGIPRSHTLKVLGLHMMSIGKFEPEDGSFRVIEDEEGTRYRRFVFRDNRLVGAILVGDTSLAPAVTKAVEGKTDLSDVLLDKATANAVVEMLRG